MSTIVFDQEFRRVAKQLVDAAVDDYYNPYKTFDWPGTIDVGDGLWLSADLMTVAGTDAARTLERDTLRELSKWESIHFYSLNVHGIRELLQEVVARVQTDGFLDATEFFHHFIGEENEHMWFFAEFCHRYGGKVYPAMNMPFPQVERTPLGHAFVVFSRILVFEQIVDHFNKRMGGDPDLHPTIQAINRIHHQDESRHIAFGAQMVRVLFRELQRQGTPEEVEDVKQYVRRYVDASIASLYNPAVYADAGIADPLGFRRSLLADAARVGAHRQILRRTQDVFGRLGVLPAAVTS
ncbi:diiron oxygenase [Dactylosporangium sp. CA-233914]|uniref:diiron oxygenase n=1 Tax=Dactylosporangium sp. CA-233914 TaxID=3239934 RepID=UPI003D89DAE0